MTAHIDYALGPLDTARFQPSQRARYLIKLSTHGTAYAVSGPPDAPAVALIHGLGLTMDTWHRITPVLAGRFRVIRYDLCGHGQSALPTTPPSLSVLSGQLRTLLDDLAVDRCALVGFSLGGMVNRRFALDHPERTTALVILNSPHERSPEAQRLVDERAAETGAGGPAATIDETLKRWFTPGFLDRNSAAVAEIRHWVLANDPGTYTAHRRVLACGVLELVRPDPPITCPTLVMTCEHDSGSTPAMAHAIAAEIAGAETIIVPALQHLGLIENPPAFADPIFDFLTRTIGKSTTQEGT